MTIKEYNHDWCRLYGNACVFVSKLDNALEKAGPEAVKQAKCLGWSPEMREYILHAIAAYHESIRTQVEITEKEPIVSKKETKPVSGKRAKYMPRVNSHRSEKSILQDWLTNIFGDRFELVWNGHSHFAKDKETGEQFYIFKKDKFLLSKCLYWKYSLWKDMSQSGMTDAAATYFEDGFDSMGTEILVLGKDMRILKQY